MARRQILTYSIALLIMLVGTNRAVAVHNIPSDTSIGTWDPLSRTYTLTQDVYDTITVLAYDLTLDGDGYTVYGAQSSPFGVKVHFVTGITIVNVNFSGSLNDIIFAIELIYSDNCTITGSTFSDSVCGIESSESDYCTITGNTFTNNVGGISLGHSNNCIITGNAVSNCNIGVGLAYSASCTLTGNTISNNAVGMTILLSNGIQVYNNNFIDNLVHQCDVESSTCVFDLPAPVGGNYWSNWTSPDNNNDGFVDAPFVFEGGQDNLPWTVQDGWLIPTVADILDFIYVSVEDETLVGDGPGVSAEKRLSALVNMLEEAQRLIDEELIEEAREQLADARNRTDGEYPPPDFVAGPAASELAALIQRLIDSM